MNTRDLKQAAGFLKMHPEEVLCRARLRFVLGAKPGKSWVFIDEDLAAWLRGQYPASRPVPPALRKEQATWHSASAGASRRSIRYATRRAR